MRGSSPFIGFLEHCYDFLTSPACDTFLPNPGFDPHTVDPITVFCIHGTADRAGAFRRLTMAMLSNTSSHIRGFYLASFAGRLEGLSIEKFAEQLQKKVNKSEAKHVILMGHSRGALVASWYTENIAPQDNIHVDTVVAICGPFKGARQAPLFAWLSESVEEMVEDSAFLTALKEKIFESSTRYLFVGATHDLIVDRDAWHPYDEALPDGRFIECRDETHVSITSSALLANWLVEMLRERQELAASLTPRHS